VKTNEGPEDFKNLDARRRIVVERDGHGEESPALSGWYLCKILFRGKSWLSKKLFYFHRQALCRKCDELEKIGHRLSSGAPVFID